MDRSNWAHTSLPSFKSYDTAYLEQNGKGPPLFWTQGKLVGYMEVPGGRLVEIAGIDSFSGKPKLQHVHLFRPVKNLTWEKDFRQHSHAAKCRAQHHGHYHEHERGDKNLGDRRKQRRIGDRLARFVPCHFRFVVHRAPQRIPILHRGWLQNYRKQGSLAFNRCSRLLCCGRNRLLQMPQMLLGQLRRRIIDQQQHRFLFSLTIVRQHRLSVYIESSLARQVRQLLPLQRSDGILERHRPPRISVCPVAESSRQVRSNRWERRLVGMRDHRVQHSYQLL